MPESPYPGPPPPHPEPANGPVSDTPAPEPTACAVCGAELDPGQTYCLECGSPTPQAPRLRRGTGGLAAVAVGLAILGAGAGALAYVASQDDSASAVEAVSRPTVPTIITVPTSTTPTTETDSSLPGDTVGTTGTLPTDTTFTTPTTDTTSQLPVDTTATVPDSGLVTETGPTGGQTTSEYPTDSGSVDPGGSSTGVDDWPAGTSGWTAVVSSVRNEADARQSASRLAGQGQPAGVLWSSDHPPLNPGYWVVFSGTFTTKSEALAQARALVAQWPGAYPRQVDS